MSEERERQAPGIRTTRVGFASALGVGALELEQEPGPAPDAIANASQDTIPAGTGRHTIVSARFGGVAPPPLRPSAPACA